MGRAVPPIARWAVADETCVASSRALYEGSRYGAHYAATIKCVGSGALAKFDPRPNENQRFKPPKSLELEGF